MAVSPNKKNMIPSINVGLSVTIGGFDQADESTHMIEWLRRGPDFRTFVVHDVEKELYTQDPGAQLHSCHVRAPLIYQSRVLPMNDGTSNAVLRCFSVTFPLELRVSASDGNSWRLEVDQNYFIKELDNPGHESLTINFGIAGAYEE